MLNDEPFLYARLVRLSPEWHQWSWFENAFQHDPVQQYLAQMPEDVRALALGEEGAA